MRVWPLILISWLLPLEGQDLSLSKGFEHFYNLEYEEAITEFTREMRENRDAPEGYNYLAQAILYREMYRAGALESELVTDNNPFLRRPKLNPTPEDQRRFDQAIQKVMELSQARLERSPRDSQALYVQGVAYGLRANYNFLVRKAWFDALRDATKARKLHNKVSELDPSNADARLVQGVHDYVVSSLPLAYKLLGFLVGFRGDKETGIRTLARVAQEGRINRVDAQVFLCAVYRRERRPRLALPLLEELVRRFPRNYLFRFEMAQMYSDLGDKAHALATLETLEELRTAGAPGYKRLPQEKIAYARGNIQFWYDDLEPALDNMKQVTGRAQELDLNTGVLAWMRLGQIYDLTGRRPLALQAYRQAIAFAPQSEAAQESRDYLSKPYHRRKAKA